MPEKRKEKGPMILHQIIMSSPPFCRVAEFVAAFALRVIPAKREMIIAAVKINDVIFRLVTNPFLGEPTNLLL